MSNAILWPTILLVLLIACVFGAMGAVRARHVRRNPPRRADLATGAAAAAYFEPVELPGNNLRNLFEIPVLYFALVPLLIVTGHATPLQVGLAWAFVLLRILHSVVHIVVRRVPQRAMVFVASTGVLFAMWAGFAIDLALPRGG